MAAAQSLTPVLRRRASWSGTPEIYFSRPLDNSRLVKVENPQKSREMKQFGVALGCLFLLAVGAGPISIDRMLQTDFVEKRIESGPNPPPPET